MINPYVMALGLCAGLASACSHGARLRATLPVLEERIEKIRDAGAYRCAPKQLAIAETHARFLKDRLTDGDYQQANKYQSIALNALDDADGIIDPQKCALDRDHDGLIDRNDGCPTEAEDQDQFEDHDGCPDPDNDQDGVLDAQDKCPLVVGSVDNEGCPILDQDSDGVLDNIDQCLTLPGPEANLGCPTQDRDGDGMNDDVDQCPDVPGFKPSGCPKRMLVKKTAQQIEIVEQILFAVNKAVIRGALSFEILDQVAAVLKSNPKIHIQVAGHTDSVGKDAYNLHLSQLRAQAVMAALRDRGVSQARMQSEGLGESEPLASNMTRKGRKANRRVDFNIVQAEKSAGLQ